VNALNIEGDGQADLSVHGGPSKAIYAYPSEHYEFWRQKLPQVKFPWGSFGENLTTEGLLENTLHIGDRLCVGSVELVVTEPRLPCYKLNAKFQREDMVKWFLRSRHTGFYFSVAREGDIGTELGEIAKAHPAVIIGSYPFMDEKFGPNTNVVIRARDPAQLAAAKAAVEAMLLTVQATVGRRR